MNSVPEALLRHAYSGRAFQSKDEEAAVHAGRALFLQAVHRVEPTVSAWLMGEPLDLYHPLFVQALASLPADHRTFWRSYERAPGWSFFKYASEHEADECHRLRDLLVRWSHLFHLTDDWLVAAAVATLAEWSSAPEDPKPMPLRYLGQTMIETPFSDEDLSFRFSDRGWMPTLETWDHFTKRLNEHYQEAKSEYRRRVEQLVKDEELDDGKRKRQSKGDHFDWLARYQVGDEGWTDIARKDGVTDGAPQKAVLKLARFIGLTPRKAPLGRPPGS